MQAPANSSERDDQTFPASERFLFQQSVIKTQPLGPASDVWIVVATVLLQKPSGSVLQVERYQDPMLA
jgi:hypothetical protein